MKIAITLSSIIILIQSLTGITTNAQSYLGLSVNYGDALSFSPRSESLLNRKSFSPMLVYAYQKTFRSDFAFVAGAQAGIAGYQLVPELSNLTGPGKVRYPIVDYAIFIGRAEAALGRVFHFRKKVVFVGLGGGVSYYFMLFSFTSMSVFVQNQGGGYTNQFDAYMEAPDGGVFSSFFKIYAKTSLSKRLDMALQYSQHTRAVAQGEYEFRNVPSPDAGSIKFIPRGISVILLYRLRKAEKAHH